MYDLGYMVTEERRGAVVQLLTLIREYGSFNVALAKWVDLETHKVKNTKWKLDDDQRNLVDFLGIIVDCNKLHDEIDVSNAIIEMIASIPDPEGKLDDFLTQPDADTGPGLFENFAKARDVIVKNPKCEMDLIAADSYLKKWIILAGYEVTGLTS